MINIMITKHNNEYISMSVEGHAEYAENGKDIVCAAVSVLVINTVNSIETFTKDLEYGISDPETGRTEMKLKPHPSERSVLLMDSLLLGLEGIKKQYGKKFLSVNYKEV